ncbi:hypothetical protein V1523DRAFT_171516 [Lipomyces doorenjongii]
MIGKDSRRQSVNTLKIRTYRRAALLALKQKPNDQMLIEKVMSQLARSRRNVLQQGIDLLEEEEYSGKLSSEHFDMALDCLENEAKSSVFTGIKDVARRDRRLERHAGVKIIYG